MKQIPIIFLLLIFFGGYAYTQNSPEEARGSIINAVDYLISQIQQLEQANEAARVRLDEFGEKIEQFERDLAQVKAENTALGEELDEMVGIYENLENENAKLKALLRALLTWLEQPTSLIQQIKETIGEDS